MKSMLFCLGLGLGLVLPAACLAAATPQQQEAVRFAAPTAASAPAHHPLFEVRYVLVSAVPSPQPLPTIDMGDGKAAIQPMALDNPRAESLGGKFQNPNMELCRGWGCMNLTKR